MPLTLQSRTHCAIFLFNVLICLRASLKIFRERWRAARRLPVNVGWRLWIKTAAWREEMMLMPCPASTGAQTWADAGAKQFAITMLSPSSPLFPWPISQALVRCPGHVLHTGYSAGRPCKRMKKPGSLCLQGTWSRELGQSHKQAPIQMCRMKW